jgi:hypothetical protein
MHVQVIRVGRKRKQGKREPNGRAQRVYENPKAQVAQQPHRVLVMAEYREWPEAESRFGRLMLNKHITPAQYEAGVCYRLDVTAYRNVILGAPSPDPAACDLLLKIDF